MTVSSSSTREAQIRRLISDQQRAICSKDVDQIMSRYADQITIFDVKPPFQTKGKTQFANCGKTVCLTFQILFEMETQDLAIAANDNLATAHWLFRFIGEPDHPVTQMWMRATAVCQKNQGDWQILHEHVSVPFDPRNSQAVFTPNP